MATTRSCQLVKLSRQPLVLVIGQVRFSPIGDMAKYMPAMQDALRRSGYPLQTQRKTKQLEITQTGIKEVGEQPTWIFKQKDERTSLLIDGGQVFYQTTQYDTFEPYVGRLMEALDLVLKNTEHEKFGMIQRIGLRYIDLIRNDPTSGSGAEACLRPGLHGVDAAAFLPGTKRMGGETVGRTDLDGQEQGTLVFRLHQTDAGYDLPPDLIGDAPPRQQAVSRGELVSILDMDHYWDGKYGPPLAISWVEEKLFRLHDRIIDVFHSHVITKKAIELWR